MTRSDTLPPWWQELWLTLHGLDKANAQEQAESFMFTALEGTRVGDGNREQIRAALIDQLLAAEARGKLAALPRLAEIEEQAAERMRERCAVVAHGHVHEDEVGNTHQVLWFARSTAAAIRAIPLTPSPDKGEG